jgi:hypothetical protein
LPDGPLKVCAGGGRLRHLGVKIDVYDLSEDGEVSPAACASLPGAVGAAANGRSRAVPCRFPARALGREKKFPAGRCRKRLHRMYKYLIEEDFSRWTGSPLGVKSKFIPAFSR